MEKKINLAITIIVIVVVIVVQSFTILINTNRITALTHRIELLEK